MAKRILVVEDYVPLLELMKAVLEEVGGYAVEIAANGAIAQGLMAGRAFDMIVLDLGLPGMPTGRDIAALARERNCPVLIITGRNPLEASCIDLLQPTSRYLRKPFKMDALLAEVAAMLDTAAPTIRSGLSA